MTKKDKNKKKLILLDLAPRATKRSAQKSHTKTEHKSLVQKGVGYTLVPELSVIEELDSTHIRRFSSPEPVREVSIVVHNSYIKESIISKLRDTIQKIVPERFLEPQSTVKFNMT